VRTAMMAAIAFAIALHLQVLAVTILLPLALQAVVAAIRAPYEERRARSRPLIVIGSVAAAGAAVVFAVPGLRDEAFTLLDNPIPGLRLSPGFHAQSLARPFDVVSHWAWVPLTPLIVLGLRRSRPHSETLLLHLLAPV